MLRVLAAVWIVSAVLFSLIPRSVNESATVQSLWRFSASDGASGAPPRILGERPFNLISVAAEEGSRLYGAAGEPIEVEKGYQAYVPFRGRGYFLYSQIGHQTAFFSREGEELWRKPFYSYPVSDELGSCILLLSGDGSQFEQIDSSGNPIGAPTYGNLISDYRFAARRPAAAVSFLNGRAAVVGESGDRLADLLPDPDEPAVFKSIALSADAALLAIHQLRDGKDEIVVYRLSEGKAKRLDRFALPEVYAHPLSIALFEAGVVVAAPGRSYFLALEGERDWSEESPTDPARSSVYRPVYADLNFAIFGEGDRMVVLSNQGLELARLGLKKAPGEWRILAAAAEGVFAVHSGDSIEFFRYASF